MDFYYPFLIRLMDALSAIYQQQKRAENAGNQPRFQPFFLYEY